jgi:hypothetical protein
VNWLLALALCLLASNIIAYAALPGYLKRHHHGAWEALGRPTLANLPVLKAFIWSRAPHRLGDKRLDAYVWACRLLALVLLGWILLYIAGVVDV